MDVVRASADHADTLAELFRACDCACFCRFWHFEGDKNAWLQRCVEAPETNEAEMRADLRRLRPPASGGSGDARGAPGAAGLVARESGAAVGWMKLAPRASLPKLRARGPYKRLDLGDDAGVLAIACMLVHPGARGRGVARALVSAAPAIARAEGARAIEAYPHAKDGLGAHEVWMGPAGLLESLGFREVAGERPYPVLRLDVSSM